jgi:hypothetical protein
MKKFLLIPSLLILSILLINGCGQNYPKNLALHDFNTAIINYELTGGTNGEESLYIRGDQEALIRLVSHGDKEENTIDLNLGNERYIVNLDKMKAVKTENEDYKKLLSMSKEEQREYILRKELALDENAEIPEPIGKSEIAGKECDIYQVLNLGTICIWQGIVLQKEVTMLNITDKKTAVSIETDVDIPNEQFELPAGVTVVNE